MCDIRLYYITTPIYYVNDRPHIGHVYSTTVADVAARYHRLKGDATFFLTGVDEHAAKVADAARERGMTAQQWADRTAAVFQETFAKLRFTNDDFVRTSQERHRSKVQEYVAALLQSGDIYQGEYEGWYDAGQEEYVTDSKAQESAFQSPINGKPLVRKKEKNYFFRLSAYRERLLGLLERGEEADGRRFEVQPTARRNEIMARIRDMNDVPISRTGTGGWGIPVPGDAEQTIYVWIDALFNYLTFVDTPQRRPYWQSGATHVIAKDILWFHAAIWPALLLALRKCPGYGWVNLPGRVYAHSFWISDGQKMSKSLGNFVDLEKLDHYIDAFGLDALRFFLATRGPLGAADGDFSDAQFIETYNTDLANTLGNCFSRVANMTQRFFGGKAASPAAAESGDLQRSADKACADAVTAFEKLDLTAGAEAGLALVRAVDGYIETTQPFQRAKDPARLAEAGAILYRCAEALRIASVLLWPVIPHKAETIWQRMGLDYAAQMQAAGGLGRLEAWCRWGRLEPGTAIRTGEPLFPRHEVKKG